MKAEIVVMKDESPKPRTGPIVRKSDLKPTQSILSKLLFNQSAVEQTPKSLCRFRFCGRAIATKQADLLISSSVKMLVMETTRDVTGFLTIFDKHRSDNPELALHGECVCLPGNRMFDGKLCRPETALLDIHKNRFADWRNRFRMRTAV